MIIIKKSFWNDKPSLLSLRKATFYDVIIIYSFLRQIKQI